MPFTWSSSWWRADSRMSGIWLHNLFCLIFWAKESPSISVIITSEIIRSGCFSSRLAKASAALLKDNTLYLSTNISETNHNIEGSSSMIITVCLEVSKLTVVCSSSMGSVFVFRGPVAYTFWGVSASCAVGDSSGKVTVNVVISFWILLTLISPFNRVTIFLQIANPSPFREFLPFISKESNIL